MINPFKPRNPSVFVALADTATSQRLHRRLRYQVYCQKRGYEDPEQFPDGEEWDHHDDRSVHFIAYDGRRGDWAGTLRLVPPGIGGLPLSALTGLAPDVARLTKHQQVLEISRVCVRHEAPADVAGTLAASDDDTDRHTSVVFFALVRASVAYAAEAGIGHLAFLTSPALIRLLRRLGIQHTSAGEGCLHRGLRYPRMLDVAAEFQRLIVAVAEHPLAPSLPLDPYQPYSSLVGELSQASVQTAYG